MNVKKGRGEKHLHKDLCEVIADEARLSEISNRLSSEINNDYKDKNLLVVGILKGSIMFLSDLYRRIDTDNCRLEFMAASSYGSGTVSSGTVRITKDIAADLSDKHVLIVEDILDTGNTLFYIKEQLLSRDALSVRICTLFDKPCRRTKPITPDYVGITVDDLFIVGYGLDFDERYRNLPYVGVLKPEIYS